MNFIGGLPESLTQGPLVGKLLVGGLGVIHCSLLGNPLALALEKQYKQIQNTKINIKTLSSLIQLLNEDVKLYMNLLTTKRYHALNDRTVNLLSPGEIDMSATIAEFGSDAASNTINDADVVDLLGNGTDV